MQNGREVRKMKKQRIFAALLAALMLTALFAACGGKDDAAEIPQETQAADATTAETTEEDTVYKADIPENTDFGGYNFRFLHWFNTGWEERINKDLVAEEMNGDFLNDAVYERNRNVEELLNIKITSQLEDLGSIGGKVQKAVSAGDDSWDAVYIRLYEAPSYLSGGIFMNYNDIPTIDLTSPWWDQSSVEQLSIDNQLYLIASDINVIDKNATAGMAFNKSYAESYGLPDLYSLVKDGKWTLDKTEELYQETPPAISTATERWHRRPVRLPFQSRRYDLLLPRLRRTLYNQGRKRPAGIQLPKREELYGDRRHYRNDDRLQHILQPALLRHIGCQ